MTWLLFLFTFSILLTPITLSAPINATRADGLIVYGELNTDVSRFRTWNTSQFSSEKNFPFALGADLTWHRLVAAPDRDEFIAVILDRDRKATAMVYNGSKWGHKLTLTSSLENDGYKAFAIAYEQDSSDALLVYERNGDSDKIISYRIWNGTNFQAERNLTLGVANTGGVRGIVLSPRPLSDEVMLLAQMHGGAQNKELIAILWNGTDFDKGKEQVLSSNTASSTLDHFAYAWESLSGAGLVTYGEGNNLAYRTFSRSAPHWSIQATIDFGQSLRTSRVCSDPHSDYIGIILQDNGEDVNVRMWDGDALLASPPAEDAATEQGGSAFGNVDCAWLGHGEVALFGFIDLNALEIDVFNFTKTGNKWSTTSLLTTPTTATFASDDIAGLRFVPNRVTNEIMMVALDIAESLTAILWNNTRFTTITASPLETSLEVINGDEEGGVFAWQAYDPPPSVTDIQPNGSSFNVNMSLVINATVTENFNVSIVLANITLPNGTKLTLPLSNHGSNVYNNSFNESLTGFYVFSVWANDTKNNINNLISVNFSKGDVTPPNINLSRPFSGQLFNLSDNVTIEANVTDENATSWVYVNVTLPNGLIENLDMIRLGNNFTFHVNFTTTLETGKYSLLFFANDTAGNTNVTLNSTFTVGELVIPLVVVRSPQSNSFFNPQNTINFTVNATDNTNVTHVIANITFPNGSVERRLMADSDNDSDFTLLYTGATKHGIYNITFIANDSSGNVNDTANLSLIIGDIVFPSISLHYPPQGHNQTSQDILFNFTSSDDQASLLNCTLYFNGTANLSNSSTVNASTSAFALSGLTESLYTWNISCNDTVNENFSSPRFFSIDRSAPLFHALTTSPVSDDDLDPGINVTVFGNITDNVTSVSHVILEYKLSNETNYTNVSMQFNASLGLFQRTFNVSSNGTYNLRFSANDTAGNAATSNIVNITVEFDRSWIRSPSVLTPVNANLSANVVVGNITINNTGDFTHNFSLLSTSNTTTFNFSNNLSLAPGQVVEVLINETGSAGIKRFTITVASLTGTPSSQTTSATVVVAAGQPVLVVTITDPASKSLSVVAGTSGHEISSSLENIGEGNASNVSFFYSIPDGWTLTSGSLNTTINEFLVGDITTKNIIMSIPSNAVSKEYTIIANSTGYNGTGISIAQHSLLFGDSATVAVGSPADALGQGAPSQSSSGSSLPASSSPASSSSGAGGGSSSSGGRGYFSRDTSIETITSAEIVEIIRGDKMVFPFTVTNAFPYAIMKNVTLKIEGFKSQYLTSSPQVISSIDYNNSKNFDVFVTSPKYMEFGNHSLLFKVEGYLAAPNETKKIIELRNVTLIILELPKDEAAKIIESIASTFREMESLGLPREKVAALFEEAKAAYLKQHFKEMEQIEAKIDEIYNTAKEIFQNILKVESLIVTGKKNGLDMYETQRVLALAKAAFANEDFDTAFERVNHALVVATLEGKVVFNLVEFIVDYWWAVLMAGVGILAVLLFLYRKMVLFLISRKINNLDIEEFNISGLIKDAQTKCYIRHEITVGAYKRTIEKLSLRLADIQSARIRLMNKRKAILRLEEELIALQKEEKQAKALLKSLQEQYFIHKTINKAQFEMPSNALKARLAAIEKSKGVEEVKLRFQTRFSRVKSMFVEHASHARKKYHARKGFFGLIGRLINKMRRRPAQEEYARFEPLRFNSSTDLKRGKKNNEENNDNDSHSLNYKKNKMYHDDNSFNNNNNDKNDNSFANDDNTKNNITKVSTHVPTQLKEYFTKENPPASKKKKETVHDMIKGFNQSSQLENEAEESMEKTTPKKVPKPASKIDDKDALIRKIKKRQKP